MFDENVMHHTNVISAAIRDTWDTSTFIDGKSENGYRSFHWSLFGKHGAEIDIAYWLESGSVEIRTIDAKRPAAMGGGYEFMDPSKSKPIKRLCVALAMHAIPVNIDFCFADRE